MSEGYLVVLLDSRGRPGALCCANICANLLCAGCGSYVVVDWRVWRVVAALAGFPDTGVAGSRAGYGENFELQGQGRQLAV